MADKRAPNDPRESDGTGEPKLSAGRRLQDLMRPKTTAPKSMGLDDSWKAGARNVIGSGFEPDEFEALPSFLRSRGPMTVLNARPPSRSSFLAAFSSCCTSGSHFSNRGLDRGVDLLGKPRIGSKPGCRLKTLSCSDGKEHGPRHVRRHERGCGIAHRGCGAGWRHSPRHH
jgi:hypothetical protein